MNNTENSFPMVPNNTFTYMVVTRQKTDYSKQILLAILFLVLLGLVILR